MMPEQPRWTIESLKEHLEARIDAGDELNATRIELNQKIVNADAVANKEALVRALAAAEKRLEGMNEFRGSLADQARLLMPRAEAEAVNKGLAERLAKLEQAKSEDRGSDAGVAAGKSNIIMIVGMIATVLSVIAVGVTLIAKMK